MNINGLTQSCKIVQTGQDKIEVEYENCPNKSAFWLDDSNPNTITPIYTLRSGSKVLPMNMQQSNSLKTIQLHDFAPIPMGNQNGVNFTVTTYIISTTTFSAATPSPFPLSLKTQEVT